MNITMTRRLAAIGTALVAGAALAVGGGAAPASADAGPSGFDTAQYRAISKVVAKSSNRWIRLADLDSRRECERVGERGDRADLWNKYRCVRDWDRDWSHGDWDRRGNDWNRGRGDWNRRDRRNADYTLYVQVRRGGRH